MSVAIDIFDKRSLTNAINKSKVLEPFLLKLLFGNVEFHETNTVDIEIYERKTKLAHFVNDHEGAVPVGKGSRKMESIHIPRTFEKKEFGAVELSRLQFASPVWNVPVSQRIEYANKMVLEEIDDLKMRILNRLEQMACASVDTGAFAVTQDNVQFAYDYGFVNGVNAVTLGNAAKWNTATADPLKDIRAWRKSIMQLSHMNADNIIIGPDAADALLANEAVRKALDNNNYKAGSLTTVEMPSTYGMYIGNLGGVQVWEYNQTYYDDNEAEVNLIGAKKAIMVASKHNGFRLHKGPSFRIGANGKLEIPTVDILMDTRINDDRTVMEWSAEQHGLPAIHEKNAIVSATVI